MATSLQPTDVVIIGVGAVGCVAFASPGRPAKTLHEWPFRRMRLPVEWNRDTSVNQ